MNKKFLISKKGYTLIELLAVMAVLITVGTLIAGIIVSSLRGSNKSRNIGDVRQAGNSALVQMTKTITYSKSFDGISTNNNGTNYVTNCILPQVIPTPTLTQYKSLKITGFDDGQTELKCNDTSKLISSNSADLIDSANFTVSNCYFLCLQTNISVPPTININFTVSTNSNSAFVENRVSQDFTTSAAFRNN